MNIPMRIQPNDFDSSLYRDELYMTFAMTAEACPACIEMFRMEADSCINVEISPEDRYPGPYEVLPQAWTDVVLPTQFKVMEDDVTVYEIPYAETSNIYGTTVVIAS